MISHVSGRFIQCSQKLPEEIKKLALKNYRLWKKNSHHSSLDFKRIRRGKPIYSVRVGKGWRAVGLKQDESIIWFWIGSHSDYDKLINQL